MNNNQLLNCIVRFHDIRRLNELERCIFSLIGQRYRPLHIILVLQRFSDEDVSATKAALAPLFRVTKVPELSIHNWNKEIAEITDARTFLPEVRSKGHPLCF